MNQNEPSRIQQKGGAIEVGKKTTSRKAKPTKSEIEARRVESPKILAKEYGVTIATIYNWRKHGEARPNPCGKKKIPDEIHQRILALSEMLGTGYWYARTRLKQGSEWPRRPNPIKTTVPHHASPSTWNLWIMAEYRRDIKAFPDWSCIWRAYVENGKRREKWKALSIEERRAIYSNPRKQDPEIRRVKHNEARRKRQILRPELRTINSLRSRLKKFFKGGRSRSIRKLMGCTLPQFKTHLESQFKKGMTWDNYGSYWHIDHILPCSSFDHNEPSQVAACWHWTNLQPLEASKNISKGKRIEQPQMNLRMNFAA